MKKFLAILVLGLLWCNTSFALTPCKGDDYKKWRNCSGTFTNEDGHIYTGSFDRKGNRFGKSQVMYSDGESYVGYYKNDLKHANIVVDKSSLDMLKGSEVDFSEELMGASFKISNPKTKSSCGCGISFSF